MSGRGVIVVDRVSAVVRKMDVVSSKEKKIESKKQAASTKRSSATGISTGWPEAFTHEDDAKSTHRDRDTR